MLKIKRFSLQAVLLSAALHIAFHTPHVCAESAATLYSNGKDAEDRDDFLTAYRDYKAAFHLKPKEMKYRISFERVRPQATAEYVKQAEKFVEQKNSAAALASYLKAVDIDPDNQVAAEKMGALEQQLAQIGKGVQACTDCPPPAAVMAPPIAIDVPNKEPLTLHLSEDSRNVYQTIGKLAGVNVLFDADYNSKHMQVDLKDVTLPEALRITADSSDTFWKPVTTNTIFVAQNTPAKRKALSQQAVQIFYLKNVAQQSDFTEVQTALRNLLPMTKIYGAGSQNAIIMRGTPDELQLAKTIVGGLDQPKPEVLVDITVMEVSRDKVREIGLSPPTSLSVTSGSSQTLSAIGRTSSYTMTLGTATAEFLLSDSDTHILQNPRLRAVDGQKATLKLGERLPVATGTYTTATTATSSAAETQFTYFDVGVNVEMTPTIHSDNDVTLKLSVELSSESGTETISDVDEPIISQEKAEQVIRLKDGEISLMAGLQKKEDARTVSGWPGFGELPVVKYFFSTQKREVESDELVFMIVPHILRGPVQGNTMGPIDTGTEGGVQVRQVAGQTTQPVITTQH